MMNMMKDLDGAEMNKQLETLGLSPSEVINKIMAEPELAAAFQKPKVMQVAHATLLRAALDGMNLVRNHGSMNGCSRALYQTISSYHASSVWGGIPTAYWSCVLTIRCSLVQAIMESQNNPLAIMNYQDDPDVMLVSA